MYNLQYANWRPFERVNTSHHTRVVNNGGVIRTSDNDVFHCCIWQYEGIVLGHTASVKRPITEITKL